MDKTSEDYLHNSRKRASNQTFLMIIQNHHSTYKLTRVNLNWKVVIHFAAVIHLYMTKTKVQVLELRKENPKKNAPTNTNYSGKR